MSDSPIGLDVASCLLDEKASRQAFLQLRRECARVDATRRQVGTLAQELSDADSPPGKLTKSRAQVRLGIAWWALGDLEQAAAALEKGPSSSERDYFLALSYTDTACAEKAIPLLEALLKDERGALDLALPLAEAKTKADDPEAALALLHKLASAGEREPDYHYQLAYCLELLGRSEEAVAHYEQALALDPDHAPSTFRLAAHYAFLDENDKALEYYEKLRTSESVYPGAMLNLGVLYEDLGKIDRAMECFKAVLAHDPRNWRARLYLKDAEGVLTMYYDEETTRRASKKWEILRAPIADFELSARARNCLTKMNIHTVGDLVSKTEEELLGHKNFGETSLLEIKQLLLDKGLSLGQDIAALRPQGVIEERLAVTDTSYQEDILRCPVTELKLSVRSQNCMDRLGIVSIQELVSKTGDDLLAVRNFGKTSLKEVEEKLAVHGLKLKESEPG